MNDEALVLEFSNVVERINQWLFGKNKTEEVEEISHPAEMNIIAVECSFCECPNVYIETIIEGCRKIRPYSVFCSSCGALS